MLAVAGGKGGSGKTTTALGVAGALVEPRRRPLVVDCDLDAPNLHLRAGVPRDPRLEAAPDGGVRESPAVPGVDVSRRVTRTATTSRRRSVRSPTRGRRCWTAPPAPARPPPDRCAPPTAVSCRDRHPGGHRGRRQDRPMARAVGTPVRTVAVVRASSVPTGLADAAAADTVAVPAVESPLDAAETAAAYARLAGYVEPNT